MLLLLFASTLLNWAEAYLHTKWHLDPSSHLATTDVDQKLGAHPFWGRGAGSPSNTMWLEPKPTCMPSFIMILPAIWPQYTNVTDRQDRQRYDSIGRTVLQMVAQKNEPRRNADKNFYNITAAKRTA